MFDIKESEIQGGGLGLFAAVHLAKGARIGYYHHSVMVARHPSDLPYAIKLTTGGSLLRGNGPMMFMNTATFAGVCSGKNNAKFSEKGCVISKEPISAGEEILVAYGRMNVTLPVQGPPSPPDGPRGGGGNGGNPGGGPSDLPPPHPRGKRKDGPEESGQRQRKASKGAAKEQQVTSQCRPHPTLIPH